MNLQGKNEPSTYIYREDWYSQGFRVGILSNGEQNSTNLRSDRMPILVTPHMTLT